MLASLSGDGQESYNLKSTDLCEKGFRQELINIRDELINEIRENRRQIQELKHDTPTQKE